MNKLLIGLGAVIAVLIVIASSSLFIVEQTQQAIVLFFGKPQETIRAVSYTHLTLPTIYSV